MGSVVVKKLEGGSFVGGVAKVIKGQQSFFKTGKTKALEFRLEQLKNLQKAIRDNEKQIMAAIQKDLNKDPFESYLAEIGMVLDEISHLIKYLPKWMGRKRVKTPLIHFLASSFTYAEPHGVSLIISPWNYPFLLSLSPLAGAIAAGNCVVLKPSEYSFYTSEIIEKLVRDNFDASYISVVRGGREANKSLFEQKFDYIFFTGSQAVGKVLMEAAAKHLTPLTLELGGKSPCIVDETADLQLAAKRIVWGKFLNAGQTCIAPDYLLVKASVKAGLLLEMKKFLIEFYGKNPCNNPLYPKIINEKHFSRLLGLLQGATVVAGGSFNEQTCQISPTIVEGVDWEHPLMQEEIFGPILPVLEFDKIGEAIDQISEQPKPLALYLFTGDKKNVDPVLNGISFGGGCINDTVAHIASPYLPFGGVGESGMGKYHGKASFEIFSNQKGILNKSNLFDLPFRYPTHRKQLNLVKSLLK